MKILARTLLLVYYFSGTLLLPLGDFSLLPDLPQMYRTCKGTEDGDMGPLDFITDHLVNFDGLFDKHDHGDEQKPHQPQLFHHQVSDCTGIPQHSAPELLKLLAYEKMNWSPTDNFYHLEYIPRVFRPPII